MSLTRKMSPDRLHRKAAEIYLHRGMPVRGMPLANTERRDWLLSAIKPSQIVCKQATCFLRPKILTESVQLKHGGYLGWSPHVRDMQRAG